MVTVHEKIDHFTQKLKIEIITSLYSAKRAEYADIFGFFFLTNEQKVTSRLLERSENRYCKKDQSKIEQFFRILGPRTRSRK